MSPLEQAIFDDLHSDRTYVAALEEAAKRIAASISLVEQHKRQLLDEGDLAVQLLDEVGDMIDPRNYGAR